MINFIEYASKAQEELNKERQVLQDFEAKLQEKSSLLATREAGLDTREADIMKKEVEIQNRQEELSAWEVTKRREEEVVSLFDQANSKLVDSDKKLKEASEKHGETVQMLEELAKRELALSEKEKTYKEEVKKEMMDKFLGVR